MLIDPKYYVDHRIVLREMSEYFSRFAPKRHHHFKPCQAYANEYSWLVENVKNDIATRRLIRMGKANILEIGGGHGAIQWYLALRGVNVTNISIVPEDLPKLHSGCKPLPKVKYICGDFIDEDFDDCQFDAVVALSSIEHNHPNKIWLIINKIADILKQGSPLIMTVPVGEQGCWMPRGTWREIPKAEDTLLFDPVEVRRHILPATERLVLESPLMETNQDEWKKSISHAYGIIAKTDGAIKQPYLSGGLVLRKVK